jgi:peptidoglycan/LPS O-acetylase OafA/YrhL
VAAGIGFEFAGLPKWFVFMASVPRMEAIVFGSLLAWVVRQSWLPRVTEQLKLILPSAFGLMFVCALKPTYFRSFYTLEFLIAAIGWSALLLHCYTRSDGLAARIMRNRVLCSFGKYSYAIYVLHAWVLYFVGNLVYHGLRPYISSFPLLLAIIFISVFASAFLAGLLSWHVYEKHFLRLKKYFPYRVSPSNLSECATAAPAEVALAD